MRAFIALNKFMNLITEVKPHVYVDVSQTIRVCFEFISSAFKEPSKYDHSYSAMASGWWGQGFWGLSHLFIIEFQNKTHIHSKTFKSTQWKIRTGKEIILSSISWHLWRTLQTVTRALSFLKPNGGYGFIGLLVKKVGHHKQDTIIIPWVAGLWPRQARRWWICVPRVNYSGIKEEGVKDSAFSEP